MLYAVIVNPDVEISGLSSTAIRDIYQGRITNWSQVGGPDEPNTIVQHPTTDTVAAIFRTFVLNGASEHIKGPRLRMTSGWAQAVAQISGAISYVPLMAVQGFHVSVLAIDGIAPSLQSFLQGSYAFWSVQHLYTQDDGTSQFRAYLSFIHSTQETSVFSQYAAIPASMVPQGVLASHLPGPEI
jgi:phosphate transport system substrate-binding protein